MTTQDILSLRLYNQRLLETNFKTPAAVVGWLGAVQSQDFFGAKWALGMRIRNITQSEIHKAYDDGSILRTHVMRPTWHFVLPADIRSWLNLTKDRVKKLMGYYNRRLQITDEEYKTCNTVIESAFQKNKFLTRAEIAEHLENKKIAARGQRLAHIVMNAELDGLICSGPLRGKQFTYALLEERAPKVKSLSREESLAKLTKQYFFSHGPAQMQDFIWWSGLPFADAKHGIQMNSSNLDNTVVDGKIYWFSKSLPSVSDISKTVFLLPNYDEFTIAYRDRSAFYDPKLDPAAGASGALPYPHIIIMGGKVAGMWKRIVRKNSIVVEILSFFSFSSEEKKRLNYEIDRLSTFLNTSVTLKSS